MKGKTKATFKGAIWGLIIGVVAEIARYSLVQEGQTAIGWSIFLVLVLTVLGAAIWSRAYDKKTGIFSSRETETSNEDTAYLP